MNTMFDFVTHVKGVEYILSLALIAGYLIIWEVMKPKPFRTVKETSLDDMAHLKQTGLQATLRQVGKIAAAPFVGLFYIMTLPVAIFSALAYAVYTGIAGKGESFSWRPAEAYLAGKKKSKKQDSSDADGSARK
jgi:hypothetical protein